MITLALTFKTVFLKEKRQRLEQLISDMRLLAVVILLTVFAVTSLFTLFSLIKTHTIPWLHLQSLADELLFVLAFLLSLYSIFGFGKYLSWHLALKILKLFAGKVRRSGHFITIAASGPSLLLSTQLKRSQANVASFGRQLQERLTNQPTDLWAASKAPLSLFQQAALLLAP